MALRSAVAVTKIIETGKFPANVPLSTATKKGWLVTYLPRDIGCEGMEEMVSNTTDTTTTKSKKLPLEAEPDLDAVILAFHSELATPIGWNDIEDPRQPEPHTVAILIFSSLGYYKMWEVIPGNLVHALVRLQEFNVWRICRAFNNTEFTRALFNVHYN